MTKTQTWAEVSKLLEESKASKALKEALELLLAPKSGSTSANPPKLDKDGNVVEAWCRFHECYEPVANMVMTKGKSKGYCKASISVWNKMNARIKSCNAQVTYFVEHGDMDKAQEMAKEAKELKEALNAPSTYNFKEDWALFNSSAEA